MHVHVSDRAREHVHGPYAEKFILCDCVAGGKGLAIEYGRWEGARWCKYVGYIYKGAPRPLG